MVLRPDWEAAKHITLSNQAGSAMDESSLVTCLSECLVVPSAALQDYIVWEAIDELRAKDTIIESMQ